MLETAVTAQDGVTYVARSVSAAALDTYTKLAEQNREKEAATKALEEIKKEKDGLSSYREYKERTSLDNEADKLKMAAEHHKLHEE